MDAARKGILTEELKKVAEKEQFDPEKLRELVAQGKVAIPANKNHKCLVPNGIGSMLKTKINVNLGTSRDCKDLDMELEKVNDAVKMGAESIMDFELLGRYPEIPQEAHRGVSGDYRYGADLRCGGLLSQALKGD